jgi:hypothetical protein
VSTQTAMSEPPAFTWARKALGQALAHRLADGAAATVVEQSDGVAFLVDEPGSRRRVESGADPSGFGHGVVLFLTDSVPTPAIVATLNAFLAGGGTVVAVLPEWIDPAQVPIAGGASVDRLEMPIQLVVGAHVRPIDTGRLMVSDVPLLHRPDDAGPGGWLVVVGRGAAARLGGADAPRTALLATSTSDMAFDLVVSTDLEDLVRGLRDQVAAAQHQLATDVSQLAELRDEVAELRARSTALARALDDERARLLRERDRHAASDEQLVRMRFEQARVAEESDQERRLLIRALSLLEQHQRAEHGPVR